MKTVFFGTPEIATHFLRLLAQRTQVMAVVSQPDKPSGRGLSIQPTPVKALAQELALPVLQPERPSEIASQLASLAPDLAIVVAYGRLLKSEILSTAKLGFMNVHFSLLPKYRGAAPVQWALARGETQTGVTLFWLDEGMDTGPIQAVCPMDIGPDEDTGELLARLSKRGVDLLDATLSDLAAGRVVRRPQEGEVTMAPMIKREDAHLDLTRPAGSLHNLTRAMRVWPKAALSGPVSGRLGVLKTALAVAGDPPASGRPGRILLIERDRGILVECGASSRLWFLVVQPEGKKALNAADFANGLRLAAGDFLPFVATE
jgi:methionyl-tRNA formyltransferase